VTNFAGPSNPDGAAWADVRYFGITADADTDVAMEFVEFSMSDGYTQTLSIAPEGKFPVRRGTADDPTAFLEAWATLPVGVDRKAPLGDLYAQEMIDEIVGGLDVAQRWGVADGQLALASKMINSQAINRMVRAVSSTATIDAPRPRRDERRTGRHRVAARSFGAGGHRRLPPFPHTVRRF
jgi:multiple sugar transport system substrate-binding protein